MTHVLRRTIVGLAMVAFLGLCTGLALAAERSKVDAATEQVESGAKKIGKGVEVTAKGIGNTIVEGAKHTGKQVEEAEKSVEPQARNAWEKVKAGAVAFGTGVHDFFHRLLRN